MSWISDVKAEIQKLDLSNKSLRKFGLLVGTVLLLITFWMIYKNYLPTYRYVFGSIGLLLILLGVSFPAALKVIYKPWMGIAFAIGWIVSRLLITIIFTVVLIPIGLIMRIIGKETLDINMKKKQETYWIKKDNSKQFNYEKMY